MKILNLFSGIGGNRKLWTDEHDIVSVEYHPGIAKEYLFLYPNDTIVIGDAVDYLLKNYNQFDFIWASPPCPTHSRARYWGNRNTNPILPDMTLWQIITFLKYHYDGKYCVENVIPYYEPLIEPSFIIGRHCFWTNFDISKTKIEKMNKLSADKNKKGFNYYTTKDFEIEYDIILNPKSKGKRGFEKNKVYRNCVHPEIGKFILNNSNKKDITLFSFVNKSNLETSCDPGGCFL